MPCHATRAHPTQAPEQVGTHRPPNSQSRLPARRHRRRRARHRQRVVRVRLPRHRPRAAHLEELVQDHAAGGEVDADVPERVARGVARRAQGHGVGGVPLPQCGGAPGATGRGRRCQLGLLRDGITVCVFFMLGSVGGLWCLHLDRRPVRRRHELVEGDGDGGGRAARCRRCGCRGCRGCCCRCCRGRGTTPCICFRFYP